MKLRSEGEGVRETQLASPEKWNNNNILAQRSCEGSLRYWTREGSKRYSCEQSSLAHRDGMLLVPIFIYTGADQELAVCLSACGWRPRKSAAHTGRNLSPASFSIWVQTNNQKPRHWPWTGARTAGHFIWEFHPVAKTAPIQVFSWSGFLPLCTHPPYSHLLPTSPPSPPHSHPRTEWFMSHWGPFPLQSPSGLLPQPAWWGVQSCVCSFTDGFYGNYDNITAIAEPHHCRLNETWLEREIWK